MSSDIITCLNLNEEYQNGKVIAVKEKNSADGCFIISTVIGHFIKKNTPVLIITLHNSLTHLQNVGLKMNYNLQRHLDSGTVKCIDLGKELVSTLFSGKEVSIDNLLIRIKNVISDVGNQFGKCNVILDGISHFFDLQFSLQEINMICSEIINHVRELPSSFIFCHCNVTSDIHLSNTLANLLCHKAYTVVEVGSLSSGLSADVSGNLTIQHPGQKFEKEHMFILNQNSTQYLYKLFDRGVKLFAPGTV